MITRTQYLNALEVIDKYRNQDKAHQQEYEVRILISDFLIYLYSHYRDTRVMFSVQVLGKEFKYIDEILDKIRRVKGAGKKTELNFIHALGIYKNR